MASKRPINARRRAWVSWRMIVRRAVDPRVVARKGHAVCASWLGKEGFATFLADVGVPDSPDFHLARRDQALPWSGGNAYWTLDRSKQRTPVLRTVRAFGHELSVPQWARAVGMAAKTLRNRLARMPIEQALARPVGSGKLGRARCVRAMIEQTFDALPREDHGDPE